MPKVCSRHCLLLLVTNLPPPWRLLLVSIIIIMTVARLLLLLDLNTAVTPTSTPGVSIASYAAAFLGCSTLLVLQLRPEPVLLSHHPLRLARILVTCAAMATCAIFGLKSIAAQSPCLLQSTEVTVDERALEQHVNDLYCNAKGYQICEFGTIADAKQLFPLHDWPVGSNSHAGKRISTCCDAYVASLDRWGYRARMEVCQVCDRIQRHHQSLQRHTTGKDYEKLLLQLIPRLSFDELDWCGSFLTNSSTASDGAHAPFQRHLKAFQELVSQSESPSSGLEVAIRWL